MCAPTGFSRSAVVAACAASIAVFFVLWHAASQSPSLDGARDFCVRGTYPG